MAKFIIVNRSLQGIVTINKEALDFGTRGFAVSDSDETFEAAKTLTVLGYDPATFEQFAENYPELMDRFTPEESEAFNAIKEAAETPVDEQKNEDENKAQVETEEHPIEGKEETRPDNAKAGEQVSGEAEPENLEPANEQEPSTEVENKEETPVDPTNEPSDNQSEDDNKEEKTEKSVAEKKAALRSAKAKLAQLKKKWEGEQDEAAQSALAVQIEELERQIVELNK